MRKTIIRHVTTMVLSAVLIIPTININTIDAFAGNGYASSFGKNYGVDNINTVQDAIDASNAYSKAGYNTITKKSPQKTDFNSKTLNSDILFFSGHGNSSLMIKAHNFSAESQKSVLGELAVKRIRHSSNSTKKSILAKERKRLSSNERYVDQEQFE